jgi:hypothetical protein
MLPSFFLMSATSDWQHMPATCARVRRESTTWVRGVAASLSQSRQMLRSRAVTMGWRTAAARLPVRDALEKAEVESLRIQTAVSAAEAVAIAPPIL